MKKLSRILIFFLLLSMPLMASAELYVIVNVNNTTIVVDKAQLERIYLLKAKRFENGDGVDPVNQPEGSSARETFNKLVMERSEQQLKYYWSRKMFAGGDKPPPVALTDEDVEEYVAGKDGGIGYIAVPPKNKRVKMVLRLK